MHTQRQLLELARSRAGNINFSQLADRLGMSRQHISQHKYGLPLPAERAVALAGLTGLSAAYVLACIEYHRAERLEQTDTMPVWREIAGKFAAAGVGVAIFAAMFMLNPHVGTTACAGFFVGLCIPYAKQGALIVLNSLTRAPRQIAICLMVLAPAAHASGWDRLTIAEESAFQVANVLDWGTTSDISRRNRANGPTLYSEQQAAWAMGAHPSQASVNEFMAASALLHFAISSALIHHPRAEQIWQLVSISAKATAVGQNFGIGLHFSL